MITIRKIKSTDSRLRRHIKHDERSKDFKFDTSKLSIVSINHARHIPILDQGEVGSCTGNAGIGALATDPLFSKVKDNGKYSLNESGALALYSDAETIDGDGPYPPNDFGSSGLSIAQALLSAGVISRYEHTFTLEDALKALSATPFIAGFNWYDSMFEPTSWGRVRPVGNIAGGHEVVARRIDAVKERIWFDNSWGKSWGVRGMFFLTFNDFKTLLNQDGDVTILIP